MQVSPWKAYSLSIQTKVGFSTYKFIPQSLSLGHFSRSPLLNLTLGTWSLLSERHRDRLWPRQIAGLWQRSLMHSRHPAPGHSSLPTGRAPHWLPESHTSLSQLRTVLFYFWLKYPPHFTEVLNHKSSFWVPGTMLSVLRELPHLTLTTILEHSRTVSIFRWGNGSEIACPKPW